MIQKPSSQRLLAVDIIRGISIFGVLFIHPMIYGTWHTETNALNIVPTWVLAIFAPIILMGTWGGGFPMISALVNTYNVHNRLKRGIPVKDATRPILITSAILLLIDPIKAVLVGRTWTNSYSEGINYSIFSRLLEKGELAWPDAERYFQIGSLPAIAISGFITVLLVRFLFTNKGIDQRNRNISLLLVIGITFTLISNPLSEWINPFIISLFKKGGINIFLAYILRLFIGAQLSYFPMGAYAFFGIVGGYLLARQESYKTLKQFGFIFGFGYLGGFFITLIITLTQAPSIMDGVFGILDYEIYPQELLFFSLGCMLLLFVFLIKRYEYIPLDLKQKRAKNSLFFRRFGVASLTFYFFEPFFNGIFAFAFHGIFGDLNTEFGTPDPFMTNVPAILLFVVTFELFWIVTSILWAKSGYKYGFEYWMVKSTRKIRKIPSNRAKLDDYSNLNEITKTLP